MVGSILRLLAERARAECARLSSPKGERLRTNFQQTLIATSVTEGNLRQRAASVNGLVYTSIALNWDGFHSLQDSKRIIISIPIGFTFQIVSATRQKNVRQKNKECVCLLYFSVSHFSVWLVSVAKTVIPA
jgi:hypothetical protein